jgi:tRNA modification GTPase
VSAQTVPNQGGFQVLTSPGPAAIAVVRAWGPAAAEFAARHLRLRVARTPEEWGRGEVLRAELVDAGGAPLDDVLLSVHSPAPALDLHVHLHGNPWLVRRCTEMLRGGGLQSQAVEGKPLWPAADILEAEAWTLLPQMQTLRGARWLLGQAGRLRVALAELLDEPAGETAQSACAEIAARRAIVDWFARPLRVALVGPPNAGKSTLANALADRCVSVVSPVPGTTRDWVEVPGEVAGFPVLWLDTAGWRDTDDTLERAGVERTRRLIHEADALVIVLDATEQPGRGLAALLSECAAREAACVALNKADLGEPDSAVLSALPATWRTRAVSVSALARNGLEALGEVLLASLGRTAAVLDLPAAYTPRQAALLGEAGRMVDPGIRRAHLRQVLDVGESAAAS